MVEIIHLITDGYLFSDVNRVAIDGLPVGLSIDGRLSVRENVTACVQSTRSLMLLHVVTPSIVQTVVIHSLTTNTLSASELVRIVRRVEFTEQLVSVLLMLHCLLWTSSHCVGLLLCMHQVSLILEDYILSAHASRWKQRARVHLVHSCKWVAFLRLASIDSHWVIFSPGHLTAALDYESWDKQGRNRTKPEQERVQLISTRERWFIEMLLLLLLVWFFSYRIALAARGGWACALCCGWWFVCCRRAGGAVLRAIRARIFRWLIGETIKGITKLILKIRDVGWHGSFGALRVHIAVAVIAVTVVVATVALAEQANDPIVALGALQGDVLTIDLFVPFLFLFFPLPQFQFLSSSRP